DRDRGCERIPQPARPGYRHHLVRAGGHKFAHLRRRQDCDSQVAGAPWALAEWRPRKRAPCGALAPILCACGGQFSFCDANGFVFGAARGKTANIKVRSYPAETQSARKIKRRSSRVVILLRVVRA